MNSRASTTYDSSVDKCVILCLAFRWSLIAGRLPGRTDNEIKNYWNSHLCKKMASQKKDKAKSSSDESEERTVNESQENVPTSENNIEVSGNSDLAFDFDANAAFDFSIEGPCGLDWIDRFLEFGDEAWMKEI